MLLVNGYAQLVATGQGAGALIGSVLGGWHLDEVIGSGGTSTVYAARHADGRPAAAKVLHAHLASTWSRRFEREARILQKLRHPALPMIYGFGRFRGVPFLVLELFRGRSLEALRVESLGPPSRNLVVGYADAALAALSFVHARGIVHRDIKPSNLLITDESSLKVLDFGIASCMDGERSASNSRTSGILGTPAYMPPEQARGRWDLVDHRSDIWALGAVLWTLLTRRHVHPAETPNEQLACAMSRSAAPLKSILDELDPALAHTIDKALAYDREDRWQTALDFRNALRNPVASALCSPLERTQRKSSHPTGSFPPVPRRRPPRWERWVDTSLVAIASTTLAWGAGVRDPPAPTPNVSVPVPARPLPQVAPNVEAASRAAAVPTLRADAPSPVARPNGAVTHPSVIARAGRLSKSRMSSKHAVPMDVAPPTTDAEREPDDAADERVGGVGERPAEAGSSSPMAAWPDPLDRRL